jgi:superfamily II DNA or RNA helicase
MRGVTVGIEAGAFVRLKTDPGRTGTATGRNRSRGENIYYQIRFAEGLTYVPDYELELVRDDPSDVFELLRAGRYGSLDDLRRNLTHIQLTGKLANLVYSMDTTNTDFFAYQFKPVLSFLESPSNGLLIADEVGLGKTIEAGLIWTEIRARYDARRLVVVCPAMLREKWKGELAERFSVQAEILDAAGLLAELGRNKGSVPDGKAFVCGMQSIRPPKRSGEGEVRDTPAARLERLLEDASEDEPLIDMVIVDESHYMRNPETQTAKLGRLLRAVTDYMVLLSATPINLKEDDLFQQLNLVDPDFFTHSGSFPDVLRANEPLLRARERALDKHGTAQEILEYLAEARSHELLADNGQLAALLNGGVNEQALASNEGRIRLANRIERINLLSHAVSRTRKRDVRELRVIREPKAYFVPMNEAERTAYDMVTEAILDYAEESGTNSGFLLAGPQRQVSSCIYAAVKSWSSSDRHIEQQMYEDFGAEIGSADAGDYGPLRARLIHRVAPRVDLAKLRAHDTKYEQFKSVVLTYLDEHPNEKVIVFSFYTGTLGYLQERLAEDRIQSVVLHGSVNRKKDDVITEFRDDPRCRILLSSEVASEGVDLQFCRVLVNYDLPWNPMKVEQRIGRIDRINQKSDKVSILNLGHADTIDHRIYTRLMERLNIFVRALGGLDAVLGEEIHNLTADLFSSRLTPQQQEQRIEQTANAVEQIKQQQDALERQASHMIAHGGYILEQVEAAHEFKKRITSEDLMVYVQDYLNRHCKGHLFQQCSNQELMFEIQLPPELASKLDGFMKNQRLYGQTRLATGDTVLCRFENKLRPPSTKEETISQFHPLIRFISEDLRTRDEAYYPLVAVGVAGTQGGALVESGAYAFAVRRWSFSGLKQEEQIQARAIHLGSGTPLDADTSLELLNRARVTGGDWLGAANEIDASAVEDGLDLCTELLEEDFRQVSEEKKLDNADRVDFQIKSAKQHRDRQLEIQEAILDEYRNTGRSRLIPALEGKIRHIRERFEQKEGQLRQKRDFRHSKFDVCFGVVRVE